MKVLIQSADTGLYLAEGNQWVSDIAAAKDFESAPAAVRHAGTLSLSNIELTYAFPNEKKNIRIPLLGFNDNHTPTPPDN